MDNNQQQKLQLAKQFNETAWSNMERGNHRKAMKAWNQGAAIWEGIEPQSLNLAQMYHNMGTSCFEHEQLTEAELYWTKAIAIREVKEPNSMTCAESYNNLGHVYDKREQYATAEEYIISKPLQSSNVNNRMACSWQLLLTTWTHIQPSRTGLRRTSSTILSQVGSPERATCTQLYGLGIDLQQFRSNLF